MQITYLIWYYYPEYKKNCYNSTAIKNKQPNLKMAEDLNRHSSKEDIQLVYKSMKIYFNIINHKENENQNDNEMPFHVHKNAYYKKRERICVGEDVDKLKHLCIAGRNAKECSFYRKQYVISSKQHHKIQQFYW